MTIDETFDVGIDTRTGVDDSYELPFASRQDRQADLQPRPVAVDPAEQKNVEETVAKARD